MKTLYASGCTLEPQVMAHAEEMFLVLQDPAIYEFENEPPSSKAWLRDRYSLLERRTSADGKEQWLNWVVRLPTGELAGYVQATVLPSGEARIAYELASRYWRRGIGRAAVRAMMDELRSEYGVDTLIAVAKAANHRSLGLLRHLGFARASSEQSSLTGAERDEVVMVKDCGDDDDGSSPWWA